MANPMFVLTNAAVRFTYHCDTRRFDAEFTTPAGVKGGMSGIGFALTLFNLQYHTGDFTHDGQEVTELTDVFGQGKRLTVIHRVGDIEVRRSFTLYGDDPHLYADIELVSKRRIESNYIAVFEAEGGKPLDLTGYQQPRMLFVPYDNDKWIRFKSQKIHGGVSSYEVTSVFDNASRNGYVLGSLTHDTWKTGITAHGGFGSMSELRVFGGAADEITRDGKNPHGAARGYRVASPKIFIGLFDDVRLGLEAFAEANALVAPKLPWSEGVPFGWNSWACLQAKLDYDSYTTASQMLADLAPQGLESGKVYVNFDACWHNLSDEERRRAVELVHSRGQKAGIYFAPFAFWGRDLDREVEGTDGQYTYRDIVARDGYGNLLPPMDGGYPVDVTHPGNLKRVEAMMRYADSGNFDYMKVDFMAHGALECAHYHPEIHTGTQAYNYGLAHMLSFLTPEKLGRPFFIDFSIAPIFPYQYTHARRISCDAFNTIEDTEYLLNSVTYGFWMNDRIYKYNDPDHTALYQSVNMPVSTVEESRARLHASVIAGTVLLLSDDYRVPEAAARTREVLHPALLELARCGKSFRPLELATDDSASDAYSLELGGKTYLAVFNFERKGARKRIALPRAGLRGEGTYTFKSLDSDDTWTASAGSLELDLRPMQSVIVVADGE